MASEIQQSFRIDYLDFAVKIPPSLESPLRGELSDCIRAAIEKARSSFFEKAVMPGMTKRLARLVVSGDLTKEEADALFDLYYLQEPWWKTETPWFERHGKLTPEEAADLEAGTYGFGSPKQAERPITIKVHIAGIERDIEEKLKPALKKAVNEVLSEFIGSLEVGLTETAQ